MVNPDEAEIKADRPMISQIRIRGTLGRQWTDWFEGLTLSLESNGDTLLTGPVVDQAALDGLLRKVRDIGLPLIAVNILPATREDVAVAGRKYNQPT